MLSGDDPSPGLLLQVSAMAHAVLQWSFRKTGTMETLASQAEICVWIQASGALLWGSGSITPRKTILRLYVQNLQI